MSELNTNLADNVVGMTQPFDFAGAADDPARVQLLIDAISYEATDPDYHRLFLDEMSPVCRDSLYAILVALKAAVT